MAAWNHTAQLLAMTANVHRDPKKTPVFSPQDFHPHEVAKREEASITVDQFTDELLGMFKGKQKGNR